MVGADANLAAEGDAQVVYVMEEWIDVLSVFAVLQGKSLLICVNFFLVMMAHVLAIVWRRMGPPNKWRRHS